MTTSMEAPKYPSLLGGIARIIASQVQSGVLMISPATDLLTLRQVLEQS